jgi:hypothetical protein
MRSRMRGRSGRSNSPAGNGSGLGRRQVLAGGIGTGALLALPDLSLGGRSARAEASDGTSARYTFVYGTPVGDQAPSGSLAAATYPAAQATSTSATVSPAAITLSSRGSVPVAVNLAATPVSSPDQAVTAVATVAMEREGAKVTLTLLDATSAKVSKQGSVTLKGVPTDANILVTPVFTPDSSTVSLVLAISTPVSKRVVHKVHAHTGKSVPRLATTWTSHHALAYFDQRSGSMTGPFYLSDEPSLALSTAAANGSELFLWTTREPQPDDSAALRAQATLSRLSVFPLGSGKARLSVPAPAPWPGGEPVVTLPAGDIARLVRGSHVQVCSVKTGDVAELGISAFSKVRARPSAVTMQARPDGTVFLTKPGSGVAVVADPADSFQAKAQVQFSPPATPLGAPWSKAVLSAEGDTLYVLGPANSGGLHAYEVSSGKLTASYSEGSHYNGLHQMPGGTLLAVKPDNPRLAFFAPDLSPLGTADTNLYVSAIF